MLENYPLEQLVSPLSDWFLRNRRSLPWRDDPTPYHIWISEIMLQQTRVEAVKPYYRRFIEELPDIASLADCDEEKLLKLWEGLGYYNRARNLQSAAQTVMEKYNGVLPSDYETLLSLKGIGSYTAGAILSIAYGIPVPAVDGNVLRIIARVTGDDFDIAKQSVKKKTEQALWKIMPKEAGNFNQALMDLGATVCLPNGAPQCEKCPWQKFCVAEKDGLWQKLPVKSMAKQRKTEKRTVFVIKDGEKVVLHKRPSKGLLAGLYEFPNIKGHLSMEEALLWAKKQNLVPIRIKPLGDAKHIFSHVEWHMTGYLISVDELTKDKSNMLYVETEKAKENYPIPSAFSAYISCMEQMK